MVDRTLLRLAVVLALTLALWVGPATVVPALALTAEVPARKAGNLIVGLYNIQFLGSRDHDYDKLARVISRFDLTGILEIKQEKALADLVGRLEALTGEDWGYSFGMRTRRPGGNYYEAYGVIWRRDRVQLGDGLIGGLWDFDEEFRNDPYAVSFQAGAFDFLFLLIHTRWTDDKEGTRHGEVIALAKHIKYMAKFIGEDDLVVAGDFNYPGTKAVMRQMAGLTELGQADADEKTTFKTDGTGYANSYDHIYVSQNLAERLVGAAEPLDVTQLVYGSSKPAARRRARQELSDHLPVFMVLHRFPED